MNIDFSLSGLKNWRRCCSQTAFCASAVEATWTIALCVTPNAGLEHIMKIERKRRSLFPFLCSFILEQLVYLAGQSNTWLHNYHAGTRCLPQTKTQINKSLRVWSALLIPFMSEVVRNCSAEQHLLLSFSGLFRTSKDIIVAPPAEQRIRILSDESGFCAG